MVRFDVINPWLEVKLTAKRSTLNSFEPEIYLPIHNEPFAFPLHLNPSSLLSFRCFVFRCWASAYDLYPTLALTMRPPHIFILPVECSTIFCIHRTVSRTSLIIAHDRLMQISIETTHTAN